MFLFITLVIFFLLMYLFFAPNCICINVNIKADDYFTKITPLNNMENEIKIKLLNIVTVYKNEFFDKKNENKNRNKNNLFNNKKFANRIIRELFKKAEFDKFALSLGFNLDDPIANSYINASINTILCMYINHNQQKFNFKKLYYSTYISENLLFLSFESIIKITLVDTIKVVVKEYFSYKKKKKQEKKKYSNNLSNSNNKKKKKEILPAQ